MGGKKGSDDTPYVDYHLSFHLGICAGPVDSFEHVQMKEKTLIRDTILGGEMRFIDEPELFGGHQREGGAVGNIHFMDGAWDQVVPEALATRLGLEVDNCPGFRGIASLLFVGTTPTSGFKVSSNYPSVPPVWTRVRRGSWALGVPEHAIIENNGGVTGTPENPSNLVYYDSNGAHIIYECMVDNIWGMGGSPDLIDIQSFRDAAETLFNEGLGISMIWTRQSTIEAFIQEVLNHINGMIFYNPGSGKVTLKLLRDDYNVDDLPELGPSNSDLLNFRRKLWGETINEIVVKWTNPATEESESITYQSLGNIAMQGEVVSENRNYYGFRSAAVASQIGARDIVSASYPLATATLEVDRREHKILPGNVIKLAWPVEGYEISTIVMRVMEVDYGKPADAKITLQLVEDVFGLESAEFLEPPKTEWEDPGHDPDDPRYEQLPAKFVAAPYPIIQAIPFYEPTDEDYPIIVVAALVTPQPAMTDLTSFHLWKPGVDNLGDPIWINLGEKGLCGSARTASGFVQEARSTITFDGFGGNMAPAKGTYMLIGDVDEFGAELAVLSEYLGDGQWSVERGVLDTTPKAWPSNTKVWFINGSFNAFDFREPLADVTLEYRIQPRTSLGVRDFDTLASVTTEHPARHYFPFRPANLTVDGVAFGHSDDSENHNPRQWTVEVAWSSRHRKTEDGVIRKWDEGPTSPEPGQTTTLIIDESNANIRIEALAGNAYSIDVEQTGRMITLDTKAISERDEFESLQGHTVDKTIYRKGYGCDYGYFFGGWPEEPGEL